MEKRLMTLLAALFLVIGSALAQTNVSGTVTSGDDGEPVVGAAVKVDGTNTGTVTDIDGHFSLNVPAGAKLTISYLGMKPQTVKAGSNMKVVLQNDNHSLDEVVVTALGIKRSAKALGYSASSIKGDEIAAARTTDVMSSLQGKMAGVQISDASSAPGSSKSVIIRGVSSLSGNNQPLYVVDGVPLTNTATYNSADPLNNGYDFGNGANAVNPDDVADITVLKGAAATALYGSRAANGVVLITTKSGEKQKKGLGVEYNGGVQLESLLRIPENQNSFGMGTYGDKTLIENQSWGPAFDGSLLRYGNVYDNSQKFKSYVPIENNMKDFFDTGMRYNNGVSFNGASDNSTFYVSFSQSHDDGIIPTSADSYNKYTFSARATHKVKSITLSAAMNYAYQKNNYVTTGQGATSMWNSLLQTPRDISIAEMKDLSDPFNNPGYYYTPYGVTNPYYILENYQNKYANERFYGKFQIDYDFLKFFKLTYRLGYDTNTGDHNQAQPNLSQLYKDTPNYEDALKSLTGMVYERTTRQREMDNNLFLSYNQDIDNDWHVDAIAGINYNERKYSYLDAKVTNLTIPTFYDLSNSAEKPTIDQWRQRRRIFGAYGQAEASWKNMVYLTFTARNDWSSTLPKGNRSFFYPGVTGSFIFSELFSDDLKKIIPFGKFRAAWGKTGNDAGIYMTSSVYSQATANSSGWYDSSFPFTNGSWNAYTKGNVLGSNTLSPEMTTETELGLNMAFLQNRISFDFSYYNRVSDKQIFSLEMDPASGYTAQNMNLGKIRNRGIELLINLVPVKFRDFEWDFSWNFTKNKSKVLSLPESLGGVSEIWGLTGGTGLYAITGKELGVYKAYTSQRDPEGHVIVDDKGLPLKSTEQEIVGSMNYKYQMGFTNTIKYKDFSLAFDIDVRHGGKMYSQTNSLMKFTGNGIETAYNNRNPWIVPNSVKRVTNADGSVSYVENTTALSATDIYNYWNNGGLNLDADYLVSKSYVKLRSVVFSWNLPKQWLAHTFLTGVTLSLYGNNLLMWTPSSNVYIDPEVSTFGNDLEGNFGEYGATPSTRRYGFNVNVKF